MNFLNLPNNHYYYPGLLGFDQAKKQKANGDNGGFFLTEISKPQSNDQSNSKHKKHRGNNRQRNGRQRQKNNKKRKKQNNKVFFVFIAFC